MNETVFCEFCLIGKYQMSILLISIGRLFSFETSIVDVYLIGTEEVRGVDDGEVFYLLFD